MYDHHYGEALQKGHSLNYGLITNLVVIID